MARALTVKRCPTCQIGVINGQFYWSHQSAPATPQQVAAKVCQFARKQEKPCINTCAHWRDSDGWQKPPTWEQIAAEVDRVSLDM